MRFKRAGSAILAAVMAASSMGIYAFAEEDEAMKKELTYVKQRIEIPEKNSKFDHYTNTYGGNTSYRFSWTNPDADSYDSVSVSIVGKVITSVSVNNDNSYDWGTSFAKMSADKLKAAAKKYIEQINPTIMSQTVIDEDSFNISLWGSSATLGFHREVNGVPVTGQTGHVSINKNTGELLNYSYNWVMGATFSGKDKAISVDKAKQSYEKYLDSEIMYTVEMVYDEEEETLKRVPHLIYRQKDRGQINAFTGKLSTYEDYNSYDRADDDMVEEEASLTDNASGAASMEAGVKFSDEEKANLEKEASLITAEDALKAIQKLGVFYVPESSSVTYQSCRYNEQAGYYVRSVGFSTPYADYIDLNNEDIVKPLYTWDDATVSGNFTINAETGDILSFYNFSQDTGEDLSEKTAKKKADNAVKVLLGDKKDKFGTLEQVSESHINEQTDRITGLPVPGTPRTTNRSFFANRQENGIKCDAETVRLSVGNSGYITSYNVTYFDDIAYPKPDNIISKSDAYKKFFEQTDFDLRYRCAYSTKDKKVVSALVYASDDILCIDAFTGKIVGYDGSEYDKSAQLTEYVDLADSKYKKYAEKLASYGIRLMNKEGKLAETETITAEDFTALLNNIGIYPNENKNAAVKLPKGSTKLNRQSAAQMLVSAKYGYELPEMVSMYKSPFSDVKDGSAYVGYITIADASGLLKGSNGKFNPKKAVTRGAALKIVYDILAK